MGGGTSGINPMQTVLSALGNKDESETSLTKSAVSDNINVQITDGNAQQQKTGKTIEETLANLNRDIQNANQKVGKQDLQKVKDQQEMVEVIQSIADNGLKIYTFNEQEKIEKAKLELGAAKEQARQRGVSEKNLEKDTAVIAATTYLNETQKAYEDNYGVSSPFGMGLRAASAALQGLATGDGRAAAVGALSPYLNQLIKEKTGDNTQANLIAHAILGGVEAGVLKQNIAAGATGALVAEAAAPAITNILYGTTDPSKLTDSQKQTITALSQISANLTGALVGGNSQAAAVSGEIGKRAVENNYLSRLAQERRDILRNKVEKGTATQAEKQELVQLERDDQTSDYLADKARNNPQNMTDLENQRHQNYVERFAIESLVGGENREDVQRSLNDILTGNYYRPYGTAYALDEQYSSSRPSN